MTGRGRRGNLRTVQFIGRILPRNYEISAITLSFRDCSSMEISAPHYPLSQISEGSGRIPAIFRGGPQFPGALAIYMVPEHKESG